MVALRLVLDGGLSVETNGLQPCRMADGSRMLGRLDEFCC